MDYRDKPYHPKNPAKKRLPVGHGHLAWHADLTPTEQMKRWRKRALKAETELDALQKRHDALRLQLLSIEGE